MQYSEGFNQYLLFALPAEIDVFARREIIDLIGVQAKTAVKIE